MLKSRALGLSKDEKIVTECRHHWSLFILPSLGLALSLALWCLPEFLRLIAPILTVLAAVALVTAGHCFLTSRFILTNRRLIHVEGILFRRATDLYLLKLEGVTLYQKPLAARLSSGSLTLRLSGGGHYHCRHLAKPQVLRAHLLASKSPRTQAIVAKVSRDASVPPVTAGIHR